MTACETCGNTLTRDTMGGDEPYLQGAIEHCEHCDGDDEPCCDDCRATRFNGVSLTRDNDGNWWCECCLPAMRSTAIAAGAAWAFDGQLETVGAAS